MEAIRLGQKEDESLFYVAIGSFAALALGGLLEQISSRILQETRASLPLAALVLRDAQGRLVAASGVEPRQMLGGPPLRDERLLPDGEQSLPAGGLAFPEQGGRLELVSDQERVGWLELWGTDEKVDAEARHTLWDIARLLGRPLARDRRLGAGMTF